MSMEKLDDIQTALSPKRWKVLFVFALFSFSNSCIWISLPSIESIIHIYYSVHPLSIQWLSMIYLVFFILFSLPASYVLVNHGLRKTLLIGSTLNTAGGLFRFMGVPQNAFIYQIIGHSFAALASCFMLQVPTQLAALWFGANERATATSIGVWSCMLGMSVAYLQGPYFVPQSTNMIDVRDGLYTLLFSQFLLSVAVSVLVFIVVEDKPEKPPTLSQHSTKAVHTFESFVKSLRELLLNQDFNLQVQAFAIYYGLNAAYSTVLNEFVSDVFPNEEKEIGLMGFCSNIAGIFGIILSGYWLDRTRKYWEISCLCFFVSAVAMFAFTVSLTMKHISLAFLAFIMLGFSGFPYISVGMEQMAETVYPIPEATSSTIPLILGNIYGLLLTYIFGWILSLNLVRLTGYSMFCLFTVGLCIISMANTPLQRFHADQARPMLVM